MFLHIAVGIAILFTIYILANSIREKYILKLPPGPLSLPMLGNLLLVNGHLPKIFTQLAKSYGKIFRLQLGNELFVVVTDPKLITEMFVTKNEIYSSRKPLYGTLVLYHHLNDPIPGILWKNGKEFRDTRMYIHNKITSTKLLQQFESYLLGEIAEFKNLISGEKEAHSKSGLLVNAAEIMYSLTFNVMAAYLFRDRIPLSLQNEDWMKSNNVLAKLRIIQQEILYKFMAPRLGDFIPYLRWADKKSYDDLDRLTKVRDEVFQEVIDSRKKSYDPNDPQDYLDYIIKDVPGGGRPLDVVLMLAEPLTAGFDTSACTTINILTLLAKNKQVQDKLRKELVQARDENAKIFEEYSSLKQLPYLNAVILETLRVLPTAALHLPHTAVVDDIVEGYKVPKDSTIFYNFYGVCTSDEYFENAAEWNPDRWVGKEDMTQKKNIVRSFGQGPRTCPGVPIAERALSFLLANIIHTFEVFEDPDKKIDMTTKYDVVLHLEKDPFIRFRQVSN